MLQNNDNDNDNDGDSSKQQSWDLNLDLYAWGPHSFYPTLAVCLPAHDFSTTGYIKDVKLAEIHFSILFFCVRCCDWNYWLKWGLENRHEFWLFSPLVRTSQILLFLQGRNGEKKSRFGEILAVEYKADLDVKRDREVPNFSNAQMFFCVKKKKLGTHC